MVRSFPDQRILFAATNCSKLIGQNGTVLHLFCKVPPRRDLINDECIESSMLLINLFEGLKPRKELRNP